MQGKRRIIRRIYLNRILAALLITGFLVCLAVVIMTLVSNRRTFHIEEMSFYTVQMGEFDTELKAIDCAEKAVSSGAAGYIKNDGKFRVFAAAYLKASDADAVALRLSEKGYQAKKSSVTYKSIRLKSMFDKQYTARLNSIVKYPHYTVAQKLYELGVSLDKGEISESLMLTEATHMLTNVRQNLTELKNDAVFSQAGFCAMLLEGYELTAKILDNLIKPDASVRVSVRVKAATLQIIYEYLPYFEGAFSN